MKIVHNKQIWKGFFTYEDGYESVEYNNYVTVEFTMEITMHEDTFTGTSTDVESENLFKEPANIKGFIDDEKMSFVMKYPCYYFKDEKGKLLLDRLSEHPDIHYLGFFDNNEKTKISGNWEMTVYEEKYMDGYIEDISNGKFEMRRIR